MFMHNQFKATDAFEYVEAYRWAVSASEVDVKLRLTDLGKRIDKLGDDVPSYLLAAYRGYEDALTFGDGMTYLKGSHVVTLDQSEVK